MVEDELIDGWTEDEEFTPEFLREMRGVLEARRRALLERSRRALEEIMEHERVQGDSLDESSEERDTSTMLRLKDMDAQELHRVDAALRRLEDGSYGYCAVTGDPIDPRRLRASPAATLSLEAQEELEAEERRVRARRGFFDT